MGVLALLAICTLGCGQTATPPGGTAAVAYWHKVLQQYPDLPEKVRAIVEQGGSPDWRFDLPRAEVRIYGKDGALAVQGQHVDVVVTDLDAVTLRKLLAWWEAVPRLAKELNVDGPLPFSLPDSTRHVVVLGSEGRIEVAGPSGYDTQSIHILTDDAEQTTIGVHVFGPEGEAAVEQLAGQYNQVRGPPRSEVRAGRISLPPPEERVTVLVVGKLGQLDIGGPADDARQDITFANYLNRHTDPGSVTGVFAGSPFANQPEYVAENHSPYGDDNEMENADLESSDFDESDFEDSNLADSGLDTSIGETSPIVRTPTDHGAPNVSLPTTPSLPNFQPPQFQPPIQEFRPPIQQPVIVVPPPVFTPPPVYVPRFGS
jgi:hypothetical protein